MFRQRQLTLLFGGWWLVWMGVQSLSIHNSGIGWAEAFIDSAVTVVILSFANYILWTILRFYRPGAKKVGNIFVWSIAIAATSSGLSISILSLLLAKDSHYLAFIHDTSLLRVAFSFIMVAFMTAMGWVWSFIERQQEENQRRADAEKLAREAELSKLRQQLQPHFLFNSLNSISALVTADPERAQTMIHQLSDFFRGTLRKDEGQRVTLDEEISQMQLYLEIEKVRFGHRLRTEINVGENARPLKLPSLLLQPLVENAIKFGLYDTTGDVLISLHARVEDGLLHIDVKNPFDPETAAARKGSGFGLASIKRRLFLLYSRHDLLTTQQENNIFTTTLVIPQE